MIIGYWRLMKSICLFHSDRKLLLKFYYIFVHFFDITKYLFTDCCSCCKQSWWKWIVRLPCEPNRPGTPRKTAPKPQNFRLDLKLSQPLMGTSFSYQWPHRYLRNPILLPWKRAKPLRKYCQNAESQFEVAWFDILCALRIKSKGLCSITRAQGTVLWWLVFYDA